MQHLPLVSVIIVTWNSRKYLPTCLDKLSTQTFHDFEVNLVNNASEDNILDVLHKKYPSLDLHINKLSSNLGFAVANNIGARLTRGKWLALLNADAFPEPDWLAQLLHAAGENPNFNFFASRQIQAKSPELLDGAGDDYHISGLAWRNDYNLASEKYGRQQREVFSPCAAAALYSREEFLKVDGFDEDYFPYFEDVDLGFRLRLGGEKCLYVPEAVVVTSLPELQELKDLILLYSTPDEFVGNVERALKTNDWELVEKRQAFARENTWEKRYQTFKRSINLLYQD